MTSLKSAAKGKTLLLRFGSPVEQRRSRSPVRERWRLWLLFAAACLVVFFMRFLQEPQTVKKIDSLFTPSTPKEPAVQSPHGSIVNSEVAILSPMPTELDQPRTAPVVNSSKSTAVDLSAVKDNTYFRVEENAAWFRTLKHLQTLSAKYLNQESLGEITYAQFIKQPDTYRGKIVSITGTAMREETIKAPTNDMGIDEYHRLVIRPTGGGVWPFVVYSLDLPAKFPRGDDIHADMHVDGIFFKNWSYAWQDGLGLAPVILANNVNWQPNIVTPIKQQNVNWQNIATAIVIGAAIASFVGWFVWRQSRRSASSLGKKNIVIKLPPEFTEAER